MARQVINRPESATDWERVRQLCCLTGAGGAPIDRERWPFFSEFWIGPYQKLMPQWTYVVREDEREDGVIQGYLTGCLDTRSFEARKRWLFTLPLLKRLVCGEFEWNADARRFLRRLLRVEPRPYDRFSKSLTNRLAREYPAHLHINLDASCRGRGVGQALMSRFLVDLSEHGVKGVHVFCGDGPVPFYERVGFRVLDCIDFPTSSRVSVKVFALGLTLLDARRADK